MSHVAATPRSNTMTTPAIVYVAPMPPYPLTSGMATRQFQLLSAYARWGRVRLLTFYRDESQRAAAEHLASHCERVEVVSTRTCAGESLATGSRLGRLAGRLRGARPTVVAWSYSPELARLVADASAGADIVHVARLHMAAHAEEVLGRRRRPRMVLDLDDVESSSRFRQLRSGPRRSWLHGLYGYYDVARIWAYQARMVRRFDRVFVCSERDRRRFSSSSVVVVPNGTVVPPSRPSHEADGRTVMFCGLLSYGANVDAALFFARSIFPEVQRAVPDARLLIVGRQPAPEIRALHDGATIVVTGDVPSVSDYYARASVAIVPVRFGGGTRIKILEAWAHGVPVVSTTIGCEGLDGVDGRHLMVADRPRDFASRCAELLRSPELRNRLATEAWQLVANRYRWDDIGTRAVAEVAGLFPADARVPVP